MKVGEYKEDEIFKDVIGYEDKNDYKNVKRLVKEKVHE